ncbi:RNA polymerase sigma factor [Roseimaritima ulvae]|uniref:RNA polymerase sigma factor RpoE n=1 Tax=Roseimaritima ulvae TaxID=980254 RepID=A0A5B9QU41_9BACT|nr:sigma-70 family RNA polymerase sigma factor [Roseimaritima ulvae]QEG40925.1 RNA polymerase sigma factor RpoE [Roseimaritima ulvae]
MTNSPPTRATLLLRLRDRGDAVAWNEFVRDYGPLLYRFVRSRGLQDADAADLVQDVMRRVGTGIGRLDYEKQKGGFRAWLFTITRNQLATYFEKRKQLGPLGGAAAGGGSAADDVREQADNGHSSLEAQWELEYRRQLAARAMQQLKPTIEPNTWAAFELTAIEGRTAQHTAERTGMSTGAVYVARSRVTAKLRDEITRLLAEEEA